MKLLNQTLEYTLRLFQTSLTRNRNMRWMRLFWSCVTIPCTSFYFTNGVFCQFYPAIQYMTGHVCLARNAATVFGISCEVLLHPSLSSTMRLLRSNTFMTLSSLIGYMSIVWFVSFQVFYLFHINSHCDTWYMYIQSISIMLNHIISVTILMVSI